MVQNSAGNVITVRTDGIGHTRPTCVHEGFKELGWGQLRFEPCFGQDRRQVQRLILESQC